MIEVGKTAGKESMQSKINFPQIGIPISFQQELYSQFLTPNEDMEQTHPLVPVIQLGIRHPRQNERQKHKDLTMV